MSKERRSPSSRAILACERSEKRAKKDTTANAPSFLLFQSPTRYGHAHISSILSAKSVVHLKAYNPGHSGEAAVEWNSEALAVAAAVGQTAAAGSAAGY